MRSWHRILLGGLLVAAVAAAGIALNFALLGLTQEDNDRVGRLSPRALLDRGTTTAPGTATAPGTTTLPSTTTDDDSHTTTDDGGHTTTDDSSGDRDHDEDD
jgi:hypothetical protein